MALMKKLGSLLLISALPRRTRQAACNSMRSLSVLFESDSTSRIRTGKLFMTIEKSLCGVYRSYRSRLEDVTNRLIGHGRLLKSMS